jgi:hypothetical protein
MKSSAAARLEKSRGRKDEKRAGPCEKVAPRRMIEAEKNEDPLRIRAKSMKSQFSP